MHEHFHRISHVELLVDFIAERTDGAIANGVARFSTVTPLSIRHRALEYGDFGVVNGEGDW